MAGSQDRDDNPVAINVVPMVDVTFCLCVLCKREQIARIEFAHGASHDERR